MKWEDFMFIWNNVMVCLYSVFENEIVRIVFLILLSIGFRGEGFVQDQLNRYYNLHEIQ